MKVHEENLQAANQYLRSCLVEIINCIDSGSNIPESLRDETDDAFDHVGELQDIIEFGDDLAEEELDDTELAEGYVDEFDDLEMNGDRSIHDPDLFDEMIFEPKDPEFAEADHDYEECAEAREFDHGPEEGYDTELIDSVDDIPEYDQTCNYID
jgi:hypothetical protein